MKWIARIVAGLFMVFCAVIASGNLYSSATYHYNTDGVTPGGAWSIQPASIEHGLVFTVLAIVTGLFAIRGRWMLHVARVVAVFLVLLCALLAAISVQSVVVGWRVVGEVYPQAAGGALMWCAAAIMTGLFAVRGRILPQADARS
jgi:hypothetical protein